MTTVELVTSLMRAAEKHTGIDIHRIHGPSKCISVCEARWACWLVMRENRGMTYTEIAEAFRRTHGAVMHGITRAKDNQGAREESFRELCEAVRNHDK